MNRTALRCAVIVGFLLINLPGLVEGFTVAVVNRCGIEMPSLGLYAAAQWDPPQLPEAAEPTIAAADAAWYGGDYAKAATLVAQVSDTLGARIFEQWKGRFQEAGIEPLRTLLEALLEANPEDGRSRLELLSLAGDPLEGEEAAQALESLLRPDSKVQYRIRGKMVRAAIETRFKGPFDLAYRLMRIYERQGAVDKLLALGMRIARGDPPFDRWRDRYYYGDETSETRDLLADLNACLDLTVQHADDEMLRELGAVLPSISQINAPAQIERRMRGGWKPNANPPVPWVNLPDGVTALACDDTVLSLETDGRHIYAGMPWGIAVYDHDGNPHIRIALGDAASFLELAEDALWAGTPGGLYKVAVGSWETQYVPLDLDLEPHERDKGRKAPSFNSVSALAFDGRYLWTHSYGRIQRFEPVEEELKVFTSADMRAEWYGVPWAQFIVDGKYLWVRSQSQGWRHNVDTEAWDKVAAQPQALDNGVMWGDVRINDKLGRRPCIIDRETLEVRPIMIAASEEYCDDHFERFAYLGTWKGRPTFRQYVYDSESNVLRHTEDAFPPPIEAPTLRDFPGGRLYRKDDGSLVCSALLGKRAHMATLPDGTTVLARPRYSRVDYTSLGREYEKRTTCLEKTGLYLISSNYAVTHASSGNSLPGDVAFGVAFDQTGNGWIPTNGGVAVIDQSGTVLTHFRLADGVPGIPTLDAVIAEDSVYFCSVSRDDQGCLIRYDSRTAVFTRFTTADGLATNSVSRITKAQDGKLGIEYPPNYVRFGEHSGEYRIFPPGEFDPASGTATSGGPGEIVDQSAVRAMQEPEALEKAPFLGGCVLAEEEYNGRKYICGTRGIVIIDETATADILDIAEITPNVALSSEERLMRAAEQTKIRILSAEDLAPYLEHDNPFVRAKALDRAVARFKDEVLPQLAIAVSDPDVRVRRTAIHLLETCERDEHVVAILQKCLDDLDLEVRTVTALELAERGHPPGPEYLEAVLANADPQKQAMAAWAFSVRSRAYCAWAPHADETIFKILMKPENLTRSVYFKEPTLQDFGASLRRHPEAVGFLLTIEHEAHSVLSSHFWPGIFRCAGTEMLPLLHEALQHEDAHVRANAALACGAVGDATSIPRMREVMKSGDKELRVAVVEGLCLLSSPDALAPLVEIYVATDKDTAALREEVHKQRAHMINNPASRPSEELQALRLRLLPQDIEQALWRMKPEMRLGFYRLLARADSILGKRAAVERLARGEEGDVEKNIPVLEGLLNEPVASLRMQAAAVLINLGRASGEAPIIKGLRGDDEEAREAAVAGLQSVKDPARREFAREHLGRIMTDPSVDAGVRARVASLL